MNETNLSAVHNKKCIVMNSLLKGLSKDASLVSFEITFTYLPTYTATRGHKPGSDTRIYHPENPNLSKIMP